MDFERKMSDTTFKILELGKALTQLQEDHKKARIFTAKFLKECSDVGYDKVAIEKTHPSIPRSESFIHGPKDSIFAKKPDGDNYLGEPLWDIAAKLKIHNGCGNANQVSAKTSQLINGVYHFCDGDWKRLGEDE